MYNSRDYIEIEPNKDMILFVWGLLNQETEQQIYNYVAKYLNQIRPIELRDSKLSELTIGLNYFLGLKKRLYEYEITQLFKSFFNTTFPYVLCMDYDLKIIKAKAIIEKNSNVNEINLFEGVKIIEKKFNNVGELPDIIPEYSPLKEFSSNPEMIQEEILKIHEAYQEEFLKQVNLKENDGLDFDDIESKSMSNLVSDQIKKQYINTENQRYLIDFFETFVELKEVSTSKENILERFYGFTNYSKNLTISAYFLHYILLSMAVPTDSIIKNSNIKFDKLGHQYTDSAQKLLCAFTTKKSNVAKTNSNTYYKTFNNILRFDIMDKYEIQLVIKNLNATREVLAEYNFKDAVDLLDADLRVVEGLVS